MVRSVLFALATLAACAGPRARADLASPHAAAHVELSWSAWDKAAFARARADNRIILVNVVAEWCHWCHVMEEETYADPEVARLLAAHFVTIKVDSDARPDVAERYRAWGWPATAILSPDARPIAELRGFQKPRAFAALLAELVAERDAGKLVRRGEPEPASRATDLALDEVRTRAVAQLDRFWEPKLGGWGKTQKYPFASHVEHALARARIHGEKVWHDRALQTLAGTAKLVDPVWGGIFQYSVGGDWDHPHYEKITAIQAGAIVNFAQAFRATGDKRWLASADAIAGYMTSMMHDEAGGFFTSQDADLRRDGKPPVLGADYYAKDDDDRRALGIPRIDRAVYADLNGMMIEALCELWAADPEVSTALHAKSAADAILASHRTDDGGFVHAASDDRGGLLYLRDQAAMGRALLALHRVSPDRRYLAEAERVGQLLLARFEDPKRGGFFAHTEDPDAVGVFAERRKPLEENGLAARFLVQLHRAKDGDGTVATPYLEAATKAIRAVGNPEALRAEGRIIGTLVLAAEEAAMPTVDVTVVGKLDDGGKTVALWHEALRLWEPRAVVEVSAPGERYPDIKKPAVYLCTQTACSTPITKPERFATSAEDFLAESLPAVR